MITTSNVYYAGYLLSEKAELVNVETALNAKQDKYVLFHFSTGNSALDHEIEQAYERRKASGNYRDFIDNYVAMKDIVHRLREGSNGGNNGHRRNQRHSLAH